MKIGWARIAASPAIHATAMSANTQTSGPLTSHCLILPAITRHSASMKRIAVLVRMFRDAASIRWAAWAIVLLPGLAIAGAPIEATPLLVLAVVPWAALTAY